MSHDTDRDLSNSSGTGVRDRDQPPRVHVRLPENRLPDFGEIRSPTPADHCIELKSLKHYMIGFRNRGIFYESATNQILDDLVAACQPRRMTVVGDFTVRGGIKTKVTAVYEAGKS